MAYNLEQIIGYVNLLGLIERIKMGVPNPLPGEFFSLKQDTVGDSGKYTRVTGTRTVAQLVMANAPAKRVALKGIEDVPVKLMSTFEEIFLDPNVLLMLRAYDEYTRNKGKQEVARQTKNFVQRFMNLRIAAACGVLANGKLWFDSSFNLQPTSSSAAITIDYAMGANNQNQLNGIIDVSWADNTANIPKQLANLQEQSLQLTGYEIETCFYGRNVPTYISQNDYTEEYMARHQEMRSEFLTGMNGKKLGGAVPQGLFGIKNWVPVNTAFFEDSAGTNQTIFGADAAIFTPAVDGTMQEWWETIEGSTLVPTTINIVADAMAALNSFKEVQGMYAYGKPNDNPVGIVMRAGDRFLPALKVPDVVFQAVVANF